MNFIMCADFILDDIGEYVQNLLDSLKKVFLEALREPCITTYSDLFSEAKYTTAAAAADLMVTPENMFPGVYEIISRIAETVFLPVAGIILVCILSYETVSMMAESNRMKEFGPADVFVLVVKILVGVILLSHATDLVNTCFKIGQWAVGQAGIEVGDAALGEGMEDAIEMINQTTSIVEMIWYIVLGALMKLLISGLGVVIKLAVWMLFVELYLFVVSAPIPFSTFLNKEWGQVGMNYLRKILSLAFQPVYMIVCFAIFTGILTMSGTGEGSSLLGELTKAFAAMCILALALFKTGSIADSIFNAH